MGRQLAGPGHGYLGAVLVSVWAYGLIKDSSRVLLDAEMNAPVVQEIRDVIAASPIPARIIDLHVWRVGKQKYACILALAVTENVKPYYFRRQLAIHEELAHITIEMTYI